MGSVRAGGRVGALVGLLVGLLLGLLAGCGGSGQVVPATPDGKPLNAASPSSVAESANASAAGADETAGAAAIGAAAAPAPAPAATDAVGDPAAASGAGAGAGGLPAGTGRGVVGIDGGAVDTSNPDRVVGSGTPASCTSAAVVAAVAAGGVITFDCGPDPVTIGLTETAKVVNAANPVVVLDGGGLVTLSGRGQRRILYQNTCDQAQGWTTSHCNDQDHPRLTLQNITFASGNATGQGPEVGGGGGGAVFVRGGTLAIVNTGFVDNRCEETGPDVGGAAVRVFDQHEDRPVRVVGSSFSGGVCSNGGALSSIGVSWEIVDSQFTDNRAVGVGANPARGGTPGGGSGGAIYLDGNRFTATLTRTRIEGNHANEGGGAVFFVSNDRTGTLRLEDSTLRSNPSAGFETAGLPGIFFLGAAPPAVVDSSLE